MGFLLTNHPLFRHTFLSILPIDLIMITHLLSREKEGSITRKKRRKMVQEDSIFAVNLTFIS